MTPYQIAPGAAADLEEIWEYIARDSLDAADRFLHRLHQQMRKLAERPAMGHPRTDLAGTRPLLFWPVGQYLILYRVTADMVEIVAVLRSRDIPALLPRRGI